MLLFLTGGGCARTRSQELLAGGGVAIGVALVFGVLLANASLTSSAERARARPGRARRAARWWRAPRERVRPNAGRSGAGKLPGVQVAASVLRENVTLNGPQGQRKRCS